MPTSTPHEIKNIFKLAIPLSASFLAQKGMQVIDTLMLGWIGPEALAAGALGTAILYSVIVFSRGTLSSVGIYISFARGENNFAEIKSSLRNGVYLAILMSLPSFLILWFAPDALVFLGQDLKVALYTKLLLHGLAWGVPGYLLFLVLREALAAYGHSHATMWVAVLAIPLTFAVNYVLIYGKYGFPALGIAGIGYAGAVVLWIMFFCLYFYGKAHKTFNAIMRFFPIEFNFEKIIELIHTGIPSGILGVADVTMFLIAGLLIGHFGVSALAAFQVAMQWASIAYNVPLAFSVVASLQVGHAVGARDHSIAKRAVHLNLMIGVGVAALISVIFLFAPRLLATQFISASEAHYQDIMHYALSFLVLAGFFQCFDAIQCIAIGILRGFKDTVIPMMIGFACYFLLGLGTAYYLAFQLLLGPIGIWYGLTLSICIAAIILLHRLFKKSMEILGDHSS